MWFLEIPEDIKKDEVEGDSFVVDVNEILSDRSKITLPLNKIGLIFKSDFFIFSDSWDDMYNRKFRNYTFRNKIGSTIILFERVKL